MKVSTIAFITLGVFNTGVMILDLAANRIAVKRAAEEAVNCRPEDAQRAFNEANKRCDIFKACSDKEAKELGEKLKDWRVANGFDEKKNDILESIRNGLDEYKTSIKYDDLIESYTDDFDASLEAFKESINYDDLKSSLQDSIRDAKRHYEQQKVAFDIASDDISDTTMKLRHAEEEVMTTKVKEANTKLQELEKQVKDETDRLTKIKTEKVRQLEEKVSKEKIRLDKKSDKELEKLNQEYAKAKDDISKKIREARTKEQTEAVAMHEDDVRTIRLQKEADSDLANDILDTRPNYERMGYYLKSKKVPKAVVAVVAALPMIPIGYLVEQYVVFVVRVIKGM